MGHSKAEKAESRERILASAARQIREGGLESISIADLMKSAGLTHGAFYAHFPSRTALLAAALDRALQDGAAASTAAAAAKGKPTLKSIANSYLSQMHRDAVGQGCAISALAGDVARADPDIRDVMRSYFETFLEETADALGGGPQARKLAISSWCTMVGAVALSRVFAGAKLGDEILREARTAVLDREKALSQPG